MDMYFSTSVLYYTTMVLALVCTVFVSVVSFLGKRVSDAVTFAYIALAIVFIITVSVIADKFIIFSSYGN